MYVLLFSVVQNKILLRNDMKDFMGFMQKPYEGKAGDQPPFVLLKAAARFSKPLIIGVKGVAIRLG